MQDRKWMVADTIDYALLKENAKNNRKLMTEAESVFWQIVKSSGLGEKCRRQYVIGMYIVDFFFRKSQLIVEIDGEYHNTEEQEEKDDIRQRWLEEKGYKVIRFSNEQVLLGTDMTIRKVKTELNNN